jgi:hypothetical protein
MAFVVAVKETSHLVALLKNINSTAERLQVKYDARITGELSVGILGLVVAEVLRERERYISNFICRPHVT